MRKALIITVALVLVVAFIIYWQRQEKQPPRGWDLVTTKALIVVETQNVLTLIEKKLGQVKNSSPGWIKILRALHAEDALVVIHKDAVNRMDTTFILTKVLDPASYFNNASHRSLKGHSIFDVKTKERNISYTIIGDNTIIGSSLIVEDAIRVAADEEHLSFKAQHRALFQLSHIKADDGNIYYNFLQTENRRFQQPTSERFAASLLADLKIEPGQMSLNGFAIDTLSQPTFLGLFRGQKPGPFLLRTVIPANANALRHFTITDFNTWSQKQNSYLLKYLPQLATLHTQLRATFDWKSFQKTLGHEIALFDLEVNGQSKKILAIEVKGDALATLKDLIDDSFRDEYANISIRKIHKSFAVSAFAPLVNDTTLHFAAIVNSSLMFAPDPETIKSIADEIDADNTIAKSVSWNKFISATLQETSVNFLAQSAGWLKINEEFGFLPLRSRVTNMDHAALQFSCLDHHFYINGLFQFKSTNAPIVALTSATALSVSNKIVSISPLKSHLKNTADILVLDSMRNLSLVSGSSVAWTRSLSEWPKGEIHQVDYFNNKKLQTFFATSHQLNIIDRLGRNVKDFPKVFPETSFDVTKVIDYDGSKNYRLLCSTIDGSVFIFDKTGKPLEGWNPRRFERPVVDVNHKRIFGKDYFYALLDDGRFFLLHRNASVVKGFPITTNEKMRGCEFVAGNDARSSEFALIAENGQLIRVSLAGGINSKNALFKSSTEARFNIHHFGDNAIISRIDKVTIGFFDLKGNAIFELPNPASERVAITYFHGRTDVIALHDKSQSLLFVYDMSGKLLSRQPLESTIEPVFEETANGKLIIHYALANKLLQLGIERQ